MTRHLFMCAAFLVGASAVLEVFGDRATALALMVLALRETFLMEMTNDNP